MSSSSREREREYVKTNTGDLVSRRAQVHGSQNLYLKGKVRGALGRGGRHCARVRGVTRMPDCLTAVHGRVSMDCTAVGEHSGCTHREDTSSKLKVEMQTGKAADMKRLLQQRVRALPQPTRCTTTASSTHGTGSVVVHNTTI